MKFDFKTETISVYLGLYGSLSCSNVQEKFIM